jgi:hypothetical protein
MTVLFVVLTAWLGLNLLLLLGLGTRMLVERLRDRPQRTRATARTTAPALD